MNTDKYFIKDFASVYSDIEKMLLLLQGEKEVLIQFYGAELYNTIVNSFKVVLNYSGAMVAREKEFNKNKN